MIHFRAVTKSFGAVVALHPMTLDFPRGRTTVLIGPSGCGKSTVLRLIAGLLTPTEGRIDFAGGIRAASEPERRHSLGYVIQDGGLFPHLTARQNVELVPRERRMRTADMRTRLDALCDLTRLAPEYLGRYPLELSGGQRQRVSLIRALMLQPELLLLDEPLGALDPLVRAGLLVDLKRIFHELRPTVVLVTHDLGEAEHFADRIVLMNAGRIVQAGSLEELRTRPADRFVTDFVEAQRVLSGS